MCKLHIMVSQGTGVDVNGISIMCFSAATSCNRKHCLLGERSIRIGN